ncbi:Neurotrypsin [Armadillidium vulgare]|nr:Neurotrypsin [Armadillidium vulgare]
MRYPLQVLCRMLGWAGSVAIYKNNSFGVGNGPIWLDGLRCLGNELSVDTCHHERWGSTNCDHTEDLGVKCTANLLKAEKNDTPSSESSSVGPTFGVLPSKCGVRFVNDNPKEILASPRIVDGYIPQRGAQPWMVGIVGGYIPQRGALPWLVGIVDGYIPQRGAQPWMVGIVDFPQRGAQPGMAGIRRKTSLGSIHECGAFIISNDLVITAAHCLQKYTISQYLVRTGDFNNEEKDAFEEEWLVDNMIVHPFFDKGVLFNNDLGIIKIKRKKGKGIEFNERVQPICLVNRDFDYPTGLNCTVAGWGTRSAASGFSRILQSTLLPILSDSICKADYVYGSRRISQGMFCAGYMEGGVDTCQGDSGGPLICLVNDEDPTPTNPSFPPPQEVRISLKFFEPFDRFGKE